MDADALHQSVVNDYVEHVNPSLARLMSFAGFGVEVEAEGCVLRDHEGREFLDFLGGYGVFTLGHRHPAVLNAVKDQLERIPLSGKTFFNRNQGRLAAKLAEIAPEGLKYSFFSNSGAEAVEAALKFAKASTGRPKIVSTHGGYHGKTLGALATTGREKYRKPVEPLMPGVSFVPFGDVGALRQALDGETACFIVEPIQGEGGINVPPEGYLRGARDACDEVGALLILDEVQTGLGRTGKMFACDHEGVSPDLLVLAKALGGGIMPIGATMGTEAIWQKVFSENPLFHTSTFGGSPLACAAGIATLEVLQAENLPAQAERKGRLLQEGLKSAVAGCELVADVRGKGLLVGVEFSLDEVGELVIAQLTKRGVVAAYTLNNPRVMRFEPALIITDDQIEKACTAFGEAVAETQELLASLV
jgi:putrescine aminotransferase